VPFTLEFTVYLYDHKGYGSSYAAVEGYHILKIQATVLTIINYDRNTFMVLAY